MYIASKWVSMLRTMYIRHMCIHIKSICTEGLRKLFIFHCDIFLDLCAHHNMLICSYYLQYTPHNNPFIYITNTNLYYYDIHANYNFHSLTPSIKTYIFIFIIQHAHITYKHITHSYAEIYTIIR